jgi:hypothetical protein
MNRRHFASLLLALPLGVLPARADAKFEAFIENTLWPRVKKAGIRVHSSMRASRASPSPIRRS